MILGIFCQMQTLCAVQRLRLSCTAHKIYTTLLASNFIFIA